jgi:uncharacterized phage protein gp47/JayE
MSSPIITKLTNEGLTVSRLPDRFAQLVAAIQLIFGTDINVDPNSVDGQTLGVFAESVNNLDQLVEAVYQSFNPQTAVGAALSRLVQLNGITRQPGAYSSVPLTCTGTQGTVIPAGSLAQSDDGSTTWQTTMDATIDNTGAIVVQAQAITMGSLAASIGTITKIATPIYGWQSVTNDQPATLGSLPETDEQLRIRRTLSTTSMAQGPLDAIRGALLNQLGVTQAIVYENVTDSVDANGQPAHSIYAVVQGGADQTILNTIWFKKPAGVNVVGSVTGTVVDTAGFAHTMRFDRPTPTPIYIIANVKKRTGYPANGAALIKAALVAFGQANYTIGQTVIQSEFYAPLLEAISMSGSILSLYIGTSAGPNSTLDLNVAYNGIASFDPSYITVNES